MAIISIPTSLSGIGVPGTVGKILKGPLAALYQGKGVNTVNYPHDLAKDPTQSHYVTFSVKQIIPSGYSSEKPTLAGSQQTVGLKTTGKVVGLGIDAVKSLAPSVTGYIEEKAASAADAVGLGGFFSTSLGDIISKGIAITPQTTELQSIISLYMPDSLTADYSAEYDTLSLTKDLGSTITSIRAIDEMAGKLDFSSIEAFGGSVGNLASTDPAAIFVANELAGLKGLGNENLRNVMLKARGYAINPQLQMIYRGIGFRSFQLDFTLSPRSKQEANDIDRIISTFKWHYAPSLQAGKTTSTDSMFLIQPSIFNIQFKLGENENRYLPKYGDCVLKNISVNYAPNGWAAYEDGFPVQTHLSLQFEEIVILDKAKLQAGFNGEKDGLR
jgi:hypothetical protein